MDRICVGLGFCGGSVDGESVHVTDFIPKSGIVTADQFVDLVLLGDGVDPVNHPFSDSLIGQIRQAFIDHMGAEPVDASELRWNHE